MDGYLNPSGHSDRQQRTKSQRTQTNITNLIVCVENLFSMTTKSFEAQ